MQSKTFTCIGDSISIGYSQYIPLYLPENLIFRPRKGVEDAGINLDQPRGANYGDSGRTWEYLSTQYSSMGFDFEIATINTGLHDVRIDPRTNRIRVDINQYTANLKKIFDLMGQAGILTVWVSTTMVNDDIHNSRMTDFKRYNKDVQLYNETAEKICYEYGIPVIDLYTFTKQMGDDIFFDHVHYPLETCKNQAKYIMDSLCELL